MSKGYANALDIRSAREGVSALFGMNGMWSLAALDRFEVELSNRILLPLSLPIFSSRASRNLKEGIAR
jgi:hypothetical protein